MCKLKLSKRSRKRSPHARLSLRYFLLSVIAASICAVLLLSGCANTASVIEALSKDTNSFRLYLTYPGSSLQLERNRTGN